MSNASSNSLQVRRMTYSALCLALALDILAQSLKRCTLNDTLT